VNAAAAHECLSHALELIWIYPLLFQFYKIACGASPFGCSFWHKPIKFLVIVDHPLTFSKEIACSITSSENLLSQVSA